MDYYFWHILYVQHQAILHAQVYLSSAPMEQLFFSFEYGVMLTVAASAIIKYSLHAADARRTDPMEDKAIYVLRADVIIKSARVGTSDAPIK